MVNDRARDVRHRTSLPHRLFVPQMPRFGRFLSRRDYRTQPGVLTPGTDKKNVPPKAAVEPGLPNTLSIKNTLRPSRARRGVDVFPGLKPRAESYHPFGIRHQDEDSRHSHKAFLT
jgi:hypothetical protein